MLKRRWFPRLLLLLSDLALLEAAFYGTYWWRFQTGMFLNPVPFQVAELIVPSAVVAVYWVLLYTWFGLYRFDPLQSRLATAGLALKASAIGGLFLFILTFNPGDPLPRSRVILGSYAVAVFVSAAGSRVGLLTVLRALRIRGIGALKTLLIGSGDRACQLLEHVRRHRELGLCVAAIVTESPDRTLPDPACAGTLPDLRRIMLRGRYEAVLLALEDGRERSLFRAVRLLREFPVRAFIQADQYRVLVGQVRPARVHGHPLMDVRPELLSTVERALKRGTDIFLSIVLLALSLPIWLLLMLAIPLDSRGPIFYTQRRVGLSGREFTLLKFRSMQRDAERLTGAVLARERDPRVTRIGRIIRPTRLDELPQLINVLLGQMSLVGPRPERQEFVEQFARDIPLYERRLNVKPGLTGWSQVHLRYDSNADQVPIKLQYDFWYIENMSLPLDLKILFMTLFVMLRGEGR